MTRSGGRIGWLALATCCAANAQTTLDRVDPARVEREKETSAVPNRPQPPLDAPRASAAIAAGPSVTVGAVELDGLQELKPSDFADLYADYIGRPLDPAELARLADAIAGRARERGFVFATATIPAQSLGAAVLRIKVDEGRIDGIRLTGEQSEAVRSALLPLANGRPVRLPELERRLLIAGDLDGSAVQRSRLVREGGRQLLVVDVVRDRFSGLAVIGNDGTRPLGPVQAELRLRASQILTSGDSLSFTGVITPAAPSELQFGAVRYAQRVSDAGAELFAAATLSHTRPGAYLEAQDIEGSSWSATFGASHPLYRRRAASLWIEGLFNLRRSSQDRADLLVRRDRLSVLRLGVFGSALAGGGRLRAGATVSQGLGVLNATKARDPLASRRDADGEFTSLSLSASWNVPLTKLLEAQLSVASQIASGPLLASEEVGLGGGSFLRAYDYSERSGDRGAMASLELRRRFEVAPSDMIARPELYAFVDGGRVGNSRGGFGSGSLASAGGGVRAQLFGKNWADIAVATPLSGPRYDSGDKRSVFLFRLSRPL